MNINKDTKKRLIGNTLSLTSIQAINFIVPLVVLPYIVRTVGIEKFGLISFAQIFVLFFVLLVDFGFNISATKEISKHRNNNKNIHKIFNATMQIKFYLFILSTILFVGLIFSIEDFYIYLMSYGFVIGQLLFPMWYFQGIENMKTIAILNMLAKIFFTIAILIFVNTENDYILVPILNSLGYIIVGLIAIYIVIYKHGINFKVVSKKFLLLTFRNSKKYFLSRVAYDGSTYLMTFMIGLYYGNIIVGYYSIAERIYYTIYAIISPITQTLYPYMVKYKNIKLFKKVFFFMTLGVLVFIGLLIFYHNELLSLLFSIEDNTMLSSIVTILLISSFFGYVNRIIGYPLLGSYGYQNDANNSVIYASLLYVLFLAMTIIIHNIYLTVLSITLLEISIMTYRSYKIYKYNILKD